MSDTQWHLSKSVPISIVIGLLVQFVGVVWMFSQMNFAVQDNTRRIDENTRQIETIRNAAQIQAVQLGRIETSIEAMRKSLESIEEELRSR